jgi:hypothetical protein
VGLRIRQESWVILTTCPVYEHVASDMQRDAVAKVGQLLWPNQTGSNQPEPDPIGPDSATTVLPDEHSNVLPFRRRSA